MKAPGTAYDDDVLGKDPQPAHMRDFVKTQDDNGGVHVNCGIPNRAFYLAATAIGGFSWEKGGQIWYDTLTNELRPDANFATAASRTVEVARRRFGLGSKEERAVEGAWKKVGVKVRLTPRAGRSP